MSIKAARKQLLVNNGAASAWVINTLLPWCALTLVCLAPVPGSAARYDNASTVTRLDGVWLFHEGDNLVFARRSLDDIDWKETRVPTQSELAQEKWGGYGWYRLHIRLGDDVIDSNLMLALGPARHVVEVYFNGSLIGHRGSFGSRPRPGGVVGNMRVIIPSGLMRSGDNLLALRIYDPTFQGGLPQGPLLLGPPRLVREATDKASDLSVNLRLLLGTLALVLALSQLLVQTARSTATDHLWMAGAGGALSLYFFGGTSIFAMLVPNVELGSALPNAALGVAILCFWSYFAARFEDMGAVGVRNGRIFLMLVAATLLLAPEIFTYYAAEPLLLLSALVTTLYAANLLSRAVRMQEPGAAPMFVTLVVLIASLVFDSSSATATSPIPPVSSLVSLFVVVLGSLSTARQIMHEHGKMLAAHLKRQRDMDAFEKLGVVEAAVAAIGRPHRWLAAVVDELARELEVRRCSLILERSDGQLYVGASVGLPTHVKRNLVSDPNSVTTWVHQNGRALTSESVPPDLNQTRREGGYLTQTFVAQPVGDGHTTIGVLNVTDRNDGGAFSEEEKNYIARRARKIGRVLLHLRALSPTVLDADVAQEPDDSDLDARPAEVPQEAGTGEFYFDESALQAFESEHGLLEPTLENADDGALPPPPLLLDEDEQSDQEAPLGVVSKEPHSHQ